MTNAELVSMFASYLRSERGLAANTVSSYESDVCQFAAFLDKPLTQASRLDVQKYLSAEAKETSGKTTGHRLSCLRSLYQFLLDEEEVKSDPTRGVPSPKQRRSLPKALSQAEVESMLTSLTDSPMDVRDRAMILTFYASGLRETELANLNREDLDLDAGVVKVWGGKGGKDGIVPLNHQAIEALKRYLDTVRPKMANGNSGDSVFLGRYGRKLTRQAIYLRVAEIGDTALGKHVSPHYLRHGFATALVEGGADIRDVQVLMRHSSVDTTAIYIHTDLKYLKEVYYAAHPRARIGASSR
jgi:integrase/recombinase XerD